MKLRKGFTLIELLTVIAITAVLMTLIIIPVVQSFNLLRAGQGWSQAQERGRVLVESMSRELGEATGVRDNTGLSGTLAIVIPGEDGTQVEVLMANTKLDIVKPAAGEPDRGPGGGYINPRTGKEDPTLQVPTGQVVLPAAPGASFVRYFIGLNDPLTVNTAGQEVPNFYNNPYDSLLMKRNVQKDNLYVLYRAEFVPFVYRNGQYEVNLRILLDANNDNVPDDLDDPFFFTLRPVVDYVVSTRLLTGPGQAKALRMKAWLQRAVIQTDVHRYDMIQPMTDTGNMQQYNNLDKSSVVRVNNVAQLMPLIQFRPTRITSEPAEGMLAVRQGDESEGMASFAPDVYDTKYGAWVNHVVRNWPAGWDVTNVSVNDYLIGRAEPFVSYGPFKIFYFDPDSGGAELSSGLELFDVAVYEYALSQRQRYPFSRALNIGNLTNQRARDLFTPYWVDQRAGRIVANFAISDIGNPAVAPPPSNPNNLPAKDTGPELVPATDTNTPGNFYDAAYNTINKLFNKIWNDNPGLRPNIHRFIDLRVTQQADGLNSPLHPDPATGYPRSRIVPGSEEVYGPDQNAGPNYGNGIRYSRSTRNPGPNQYRINYVNLTEPNYTLLGLANPPPAYDPQNFMSVIYQPRYKAGYLQLNSDPNVPLPTGQIQVYYKFQMTNPKDVFAVDYDTRQLMSVLLTIRNYPQTTTAFSNTITLRASAKVRNFLR